MGSKRAIVLGGFGLLAVVLWAAPQAKTLFINGKSYAQPIITQSGQRYVSVAALKAAGAEVTETSTRLSIQFKPMQDRLQTNAVEGVQGEWIQNEAWRVRATEVKTIPSPFGRGPGVQVTLEMRNLADRAAAPFGSGLDKIQVLDEAGVVLSVQPASFKDQFTSLSKGAGLKNDLKFGDPSNGVTVFGKPAKMLLLFRNSGGKKHKDIRIDLN